MVNLWIIYASGWWLVGNLWWIYGESMVNQWFTGWWFQPTPLKNMKVNWDDYPLCMGK